MPESPKHLKSLVLPGAPDLRGEHSIAVLLLSRAYEGDIGGQGVSCSPGIRSFGQMLTSQAVRQPTRSGQRLTPAHACTQ